MCEKCNIIWSKWSNFWFFDCIVQIAYNLIPFECGKLRQEIENLSSSVQNGKKKTVSFYLFLIVRELIHRYKQSKQKFSILGLHFNISIINLKKFNSPTFDVVAKNGMLKNAVTLIPENAEKISLKLADCDCAMYKTVVWFNHASEFRLI